MRLVETVAIDAPASTVWSVLADVSRWPEWTPSMTSVTLQPPFALGATARVRQPRLLPAKWTVTSIEEGRQFTWETRSAGVRITADHRIVESSGDSTTVEFTLEMTGPLAGLTGMLFGGAAKRNVATEAAGLKQRCESGLPTPGAPTPGAPPQTSE